MLRRLTSALSEKKTAGLSNVNTMQRLCQVKEGRSEANLWCLRIDGIRVDLSDMKGQNERAIQKAVITTIIMASSPLLPSEHLRGSCCNKQLSRLLFDCQATSLETAVVHFLFAHKPGAKIACSSCNPLICLHEVSPALQLPTQAIHAWTFGRFVLFFLHLRYMGGLRSSCSL